MWLDEITGNNLETTNQNLLMQAIIQVEIIIV